MDSLEFGVHTSSHQRDIRRSFSAGRGSSRRSWRRGSFRLSQDGSLHVPEEVLDEIFAQAGDSGGRVIDDGSLRFQLDDTQPEENHSISVELEHHRIHADEHASLETPSPSPHVISPRPTDAVLYSREKNMSKSAMQIVRSLSNKEKKYEVPWLLNYLLYLIHLAVFGILGAITRYFLQKLFGSGVLAFTSDQTSFYPDLPANMVGSFLMGWFGVVLKGDMLHIADHLAVGLTTGYLGSLTTFSGWNQKMLELSSNDHWVFSVAGILLGMFLVNESINVGVESAGWFRKCILHRLGRSPDGLLAFRDWRIDRQSRHMTVMTMMLTILGCLWGISGAFARRKLEHASTVAVLWLGCLVAPPGVWLRWYLARLNGRGIGKRMSMLKWFPFGTLAANVLAACLMAALATLSEEVNTRKSMIIMNGIQFGFLGCLSTVSTFVAEVYAMRQSGHPGRALAYATATLISSFALGTLIYSLPVWKKHYQ